MRPELLQLPRRIGGRVAEKANLYIKKKITIYLQHRKLSQEITTTCKAYILIEYCL